MNTSVNQLNNRLNEYNNLIDEQRNTVNQLNDRVNEQNNIINDQRNTINHINSRSQYLLHKYAHESKYPEILSDWYLENTGEKLDLNNPRTYNEKIQWLKLYDSTPIKTKLADKLLVRDWIKEKIGEEYLIPLLGVYDSFDEINFNELPDQFVIKCNHGSSMNIVVKDKSKLNTDQARQDINKWMHTNFAYIAGLELHYRDIKPKIIIEEYLQDNYGELLDYKIFCFAGKPKYIQVDFDRYTNHTRNIYDLNWNLQPFNITFPNGENILPPNNLSIMVELAKILCSNFIHVRVDFYSIENKTYFGEMTFTPGTGIRKITPEEWNYKLGDLIEIPVGDKYFLNKKIETAEIIHFMFNDKFANPTIEFINKYFDKNEHLFLVYRVHPDSYSAQPFPIGENVVELDYDILEPENLKNKKLIFHALVIPENIKLLYENKYILKHSYWMIWSTGDLNLAPDERYDYVKSNIYGIGTGSLKETAIQKYGNNHKYFNTAMAIQPMKDEYIQDVIKEIDKSDNSIVIQINQCSNESILDMLDILSKFKNENIKIRTVLSYGKMEYVNEIINKGKQIFREKYSYLDKMISPKNYLKFILQNDILILNKDAHNSFGNIKINLFAGKKVFIKNSDYAKYFIDIGFSIFDSNKIKDMSFEDFISFSEEDKIKNKEAYIKHFSDEAILERIKPIFDDDCFENDDNLDVKH